MQQESISVLLNVSDNLSELYMLISNDAACIQLSFAYLLSFCRSKRVQIQNAAVSSPLQIRETGSDSHFQAMFAKLCVFRHMYGTSLVPRQVQGTLTPFVGRHRPHSCM